MDTPLPVYVRPNEVKNGTLEGQTLAATDLKLGIHILLSFIHLFMKKKSYTPGVQNHPG